MSKKNKKVRSFRLIDKELHVFNGNIQKHQAWYGFFEFRTLTLYIQMKFIIKFLFFD